MPTNKEMLVAIAKNYEALEARLAKALPGIVAPKKEEEAKPLTQWELDYKEVKIKYDLSDDWETRAQSMVYSEPRREGINIARGMLFEKAEGERVASELQARRDYLNDQKRSETAKANVEARRAKTATEATAAEIAVEKAALAASEAAAQAAKGTGE